MFRVHTFVCSVCIAILNALMCVHCTVDDNNKSNKLLLLMQFTGLCYLRKVTLIYTRKAECL